MNALIVYHNKNSIILPYIISKFPKYTAKSRVKLTIDDYKNKEIIIVIGGDGTFLRASHLNTNIPMFGINPKPHRKVGFFTRANNLNFKKKIELILKNDFFITKTLRLEAKINDQLIKDLCLNEIYVEHHKPYYMFNYDLSINKKTEFQRSSGVLIGTPSGSHAWIASAGGKKLNIKSRKYQLIAREPYISRLTSNYNLTKLNLVEKDIVKIKCKTKSVLVMDSIGKVHKLNPKDIVEISVSKHDLKIISFQKS